MFVSDVHVANCVYRHCVLQKNIIKLKFTSVVMVPGFWNSVGGSVFLTPVAVAMMNIALC